MLEKDVIHGMLSASLFTVNSWKCHPLGFLSSSPHSDLQQLNMVWKASAEAYHLSKKLSCRFYGYLLVLWISKSISQVHTSRYIFWRLRLDLKGTNLRNQAWLEAKQNATWVIKHFEDQDYRMSTAIQAQVLCLLP